MIQLFKHFDDFTDDQVIGVANDLTPHYFDHVQDFIKQNPGTQIGSPGRFQVGKFICFYLCSLHLIGLQYGCCALQPVQDEDQRGLQCLHQARQDGVPVQQVHDGWAGG